MHEVLKLQINPGDYFQLTDQERRMSDLFRAVIIQSIRDMSRTTAGDQERVAIGLEAIQWIGTEDFQECCLYAIIDHQELEDRLREILQMKQPYRKLMLRDLADLLKDPPPAPERTDGALEYGLASEPELEPLD